MPTLLYKIVREDPLPPQRLNNTLSSQVETVLSKALAKLPEDRFENCTEFINALAIACNANPAWTPLPRGLKPEHAYCRLARRSCAKPWPTPARPLPCRTPPITKPLPRDSCRHRRLCLAAPVAIPVRADSEIEPEGSQSRVTQRSAEHRHRSGAGRGDFCRHPKTGRATRSSSGTSSAGARPKLSRPRRRFQPPAAPPPLHRWQPLPPWKPPAPPEAVQPRNRNRLRPAPQPQRVAATPPPVSVPEEGTFQLTTSPAGATATFDTSGIECTTPCNLTLPAGRHTFVLRHAGYRETQRIITIPNDTGLIVELVPMTGTLT